MKKDLILDMRINNNNKRVNELRQAIRNRYNKIISNYDLSLFLRKAMCFSEMQTWLLDANIQGKKISEVDLYEKLFALKTNDELLELYEKELNENEKNSKRGVTYPGRIRRR